MDPGGTLLVGGCGEHDVVEGLDVGRRMVARHVAVVAPPDVHAGPRIWSTSGGTDNRW
jgi:hypothetical protein